MAGSSAHVDHASHGGHADAEVETPEQAAERARSEAVTASVARVVGRPLGLLLAIGGAGVSLAFASRLGHASDAAGWLWILPSILATGWGIALLRSGHD